MANFKILIVDDDPATLSIMKSYLSVNKKYDILSANNGLIALNILIAEKPDIIITDWDMPEMTGLELIQNIQANEETAKIPVIMCSGVMVKSADMVNALEKGAVDFLRKPVVASELIARVSAVIRLLEVNRKLANEQRERLAQEKKVLEERFEFQSKELDGRLKQISKYNELLRNTAYLLRGMPDISGNELFTKQIENIISTINKTIVNENWKNFSFSFLKLYPDFFIKLRKKFPGLTKNEIRLCAFLRLDLSTKEIAAVTMQTQRAVEMARHRLRVKLQIDFHEEITDCLSFNSKKQNES